ncbi:MAG: HIT family protein [Dysgonamonadaceae bacterium]|jgi:histidine triad (HIT) family protein|nr:HIT family protein [Dysgonamonadaceae bacterium]
MSSIFSKIIAGEIPSYQIVANRDHIAFLDINPVAKGHVLIVPKKETDYIFDLDDASLADMMIFAKRVAKAMKKVIECKKIGVAVMGLEVPHVHIHLIPVTDEKDMSFEKPRKQLSPQEFGAIAAAIADAFK